MSQNILNEKKTCQTLCIVRPFWCGKKNTKVTMVAVLIVSVLLVLQNE